MEVAQYLAGSIRCSNSCAIRIPYEWSMVRTRLSSRHLDPISRCSLDSVEVHLMGFLFVMLFLAFIVLMFKHINLSLAHTKLTFDLSQSKIDYGNLHHTALLIQEERNNLKKSRLPDQQLVKELIVFCHPDKHHGSEKASRLTQELLKVRDGK